MTEWATFAGFTGVVLTVLLSLAHLSRDVPSDIADARGESSRARGESRRTETGLDTRRADSAPDFDTDETRADGFDIQPATPEHATEFFPVGVNVTHLSEQDLGAAGYDSPSAPNPGADIPPYVLLANVIVGQALLGALLAMGAWYSGIPLSALGLSSADLPTMVGLGIALGLSLYAANRVGATASRQFGFAPDESLRASLTPESTRGWLLLFLVALPLIAGFEELLFRGALIGAAAAGFGLSPWLMAALSSVAFGIGHGAQGRLGILVTGLLGFVLGAAFVLTGSLVVVIVAHYLVNALEFVGHELFDWE
ncbi:CPBP family intramembrane glutamic endopeptidase [Haloferax namakaokahaiae]|uniref:CPBP family intramembrane glutamic endopeptidase n=1 Tax=Haloferax namakaokahaiae TaxID=1748331 RepID=A0ABD5ZHG0_9EURY